MVMKSEMKKDAEKEKDYLNIKIILSLNKKSQSLPMKKCSSFSSVGMLQKILKLKSYMTKNKLLQP